MVVQSDLGRLSSWFSAKHRASIYIYISLKVLGPQKEWSLPRGPEWVHSPRVSQHCRGSTRRGSAEGSPRVRQGHLPFYHDHGPHDNCLRLCKLFSVRSCFALDLLSIALDLLSICSRFSICPRLLFRSPRLLFRSSSVLLKSYSAMLSLALDLLSICSRSLSICSRLLWYIWSSYTGSFWGMFHEILAKAAWRA